MALDPLKFAIAIEKNNLNTMLADARKEIEKGLKDVPVTLKIENLQKIKEELQNIEIKIKTTGGGGLGGSVTDMSAYEKKLKDLEKLYEQLANKMESIVKQSKAAADAEKKVGDAANQSGDDEETAKNKAARAAERYLKLLQDIENQIAKINNVIAKGESLNINSAVLRPTESAFKNLFQRVGDASPSDVEKVKALNAEFARLKSMYDEVVKAADRLNKATEKSNTDGIKDLESRMRSAERAADNLYNRILKLDSSRNDFRGMDTSKLDNAIESIKRVREELKSFSTTGKSDYGTNANEISRAMGLAQAIRDAAEAQKALRKEQSEAESRMNKLLSEAQSGYDRVQTKIAEVVTKLEKYNTALAGAEGKPISTRRLEADKQQVEELLQLLQQIKKNKGFTDDNRTMREVMRDYGQHIKYADAAMSSLNKQVREHNKNAQKDPAVESTKEYASLVKQIANMQKTELKASALGIDTTELRNKIALLEQYKKQLEQIVNAGGNGYSAFRTPGYINARAEGGIERQRIDAAYQLEKANQAAANTASHLSESEKRLADAIRGSTDSMRGQSQVLSDLKSMAMQYLSVWGAQSFLNNIIEIGGQLEMQRLSIGAILQDVAHANDLFDKIKGLALQSPFGVVELDQFTKQLSAYGFKYNELFDMTKRLADISAGAGTEVSRLALALGHVRAEGALTGYTLRQFAMNNIPMIGKLSEKLSEMEGRIVTAAEVRKRVSKKEIDYSMVEDVIKDLTNEGGMFYNMQEVISGSVKAKWKNLRDAFDIMYGEMAESAVGGALKGVATMLTTLAKRWKTIGTVVAAVAAAYGTWRVVMLAYNSLLGQQTKAVFATIAAERKAEISKLKLAQSYRTLSAAEKARIASTKQLLASELRAAISSKALTTEQLAKAVAMGKVSKATALNAVSTAILDKEEKKLMYTTIQNTRVLGFWGKALYGVRASWLAFIGTLKTVFLNPMSYVMAAISAITYLWQRNNEEMSRAEELGKAISQRATEGLKNIRSMMAETGISYTKADASGKMQDITGSFGDVRGGTINVTPAASLDSDAMIQTMEKWEEFIKNYAATPNKILKDAFWDEEGNVRSLTEQYERLSQAVTMVSEAYVTLGKYSDIAEMALKSTGSGMLWGWFNDDLITNMNQFAKAARKYQNALMNIASSQPKLLANGLKAAKADRDFAEALNEANKAMYEKSGRNMTEVEQLDFLIKNQEEYTKAMNAFNVKAKTVAGSPSDMFDVMHDSESTLDEDIEQFATRFKSDIRQTFHKSISQLTEGEKQNVIHVLNDIVAKSDAATDEIRQQVAEKLGKEIGIKLDINEIETLHRIGQVEEELNKLMMGPDGTGSWPIDIKGVVNANDLVQKVREAYKKAKDTINNMQPIAIKMGLSLGKVKVMSEEEIKNAAGGSAIREMALRAINEAYKQIEAAEKASNTYGFSLSDPNSGGKTFKDKKTKNTKSEKDVNAERLRKLMKVLKEAANSFLYWKKAVGEGGAFQHVTEEFGKLMQELGLNVKDADQLRQKLEALRREFEQKPKTKQMVEALKELDKELADLNRKDFEKRVEDMTSKMKKDLDDMTRKWEIFNSVREATGDKALAASMAGISDFARDNYRNAADNMVESISEALSQMGVFGNVLEGVEDMSDAEIEDHVKALLGGTEYENQIKAISDAMKEWRNLERNAIKADIDMYAKLVGSAVDYQHVIEKNNDIYEKQKDALDDQLKRGEINQSQYEKALEIARAQRDSKNGKLTSEYVNLMNNANALVRGNVLDAIDNAIMHLNEDLANGQINAADYADQLARLKKIQSDWDDNAFFGKNNAFTNYLQRGLPGLLAFFEGKQNNAIRDGRYEEAEEYQKTIDKIRKVQSTLGDLATVIELIVGIFDGLQKAATALSNMFDALGHKGSANTWSDIADGIGAIGSIFSPASNVIQNAQSGNVGGLVSSAIAAPFQMVAGPIEGFAKLHDKRRERQIEELRKDVQKIDATLNLIRTSRGRTLGYDNGEYRRMMAMMYAGDNSASGKAMYEYYSRGGNNGSGYQQELESLKKQREEYLRMYDIENSKKKKSEESLEEYKQKMAELDDQIKNYSMDLAKELWSIDLKGWADQIGDALMNAFENGTSAANAFKDATQSIMQSVVSEMLKVGFMQPMLKNLESRLFGENGKFNPSDPKSSMGEVLAELGRFFGQDGEGNQMMTAASEFLSGAEELLNKNFGMSLKSNTSSASQTSGIQSQATEESIGIVSGQLARIAQDVSVKRIFLTQFVTTQMPAMLDKVEQQRVLLDSQFQSVRAIQSMMQDGNGAMYEAIYTMSNKIDRAITPDGKMRIQ